MTEQGVVYVLEVADRAGVAHAIAAVFAHRGLSMRSFVTDTGRRPPRILVSFRGTPRQCRMVEQVLARLHHVVGVRVLDEESPELHAVAVFRCAGVLPDLPEVTVQRHGETCVLLGGYGAVERALLRIAASCAVGEVSRSLAAL